MTKEFDIIKLSNVCEPKSANRIIFLERRRNGMLNMRLRRWPKELIN